MDNIVVALISSLDSATTALICFYLVHGKAWVVCPYALWHSCVDSFVLTVPPQAHRSCKFSHPLDIHDVPTTCKHERSG